MSAGHYYGESLQTEACEDRQSWHYVLRYLPKRLWGPPYTCSHDLLTSPKKRPSTQASGLDGCASTRTSVQRCLSSEEET